MGDATPALPTQNDYLNGVIGSLKAQAQKETENSLFDFQGELNSEAEPKPTSYATYAVDVAKVTALFNGTDTNSTDWNSVIVETMYTPPPPAPAPPPVFPIGYPVGPQLAPGIFQALDDGNLPQFPDGAQWTVHASVPGGAPAGNYIKRMNPTPWGFEPYWVPAPPAALVIGGTN